MDRMKLGKLRNIDENEREEIEFFRALFLDTY